MMVLILITLKVTQSKVKTMKRLRRMRSITTTTPKTIMLLPLWELIKCLLNLMTTMRRRQKKKMKRREDHCLRSKSLTSTKMRRRSLLKPAAALSNTRTTDHRVRFAIDDTDQNEHSQALPAAVAAPALPPPPVINQRELFISVSNKASKILFQSSMACNELASRKRKASEDEGETKKKKEKKFSFGTLFDRAKRLWPSHPNDDEEEEEERQQQV
mmetsp:Transcript_17066/g.34125  ORF Transcript_17066/g.34125 Transcript_17066/m.34125 type:complete len:215 (+) Transcript_17066:105-749(+)